MRSLKSRVSSVLMQSVVVGVLCSSASTGAAAQGVTPQDEYMRRLKVYQTVQPSGETPFGEQINLYTGDLTFRQADVIVEGTGPTIHWYVFWSPVTPTTRR